MKYDSKKTPPSVKFINSKKGSVEEGINILMGLFIFVLVAAFVVYFMTSYINKFEEQTFLDSVSELQYAMDYACATGTETYVEVRMPQKISNAVNWIAAYGDPKYMVYFERFPVGEEWAWTTLRPVNLGMLLAENVVIGVATAAVPGGLSKVGNMFKSSKAGGYLYRIYQKIGGTRLGKSILDGLYEKEAGVITRKAQNAADITTGATMIQNKGKFLGNFLGIDDAIRKLKAFFGRGSSDDAIKAISKTFQSEQYIGGAGKKLQALQDAISLGGKVPNDAELKLLQMSGDEMGDIDEMEKMIKYIDDNIQAKSFKDLKPEIQEYRDSLENVRKFRKGIIEPPSGSKYTQEDVKAFFEAYQEIYKSLGYIQIPRNIILPAVAGKGTWAANTYFFDALLSPLDRANEKFSTCGAKALCAKTQNYIAVYPLAKCENNGIEYVRLNVQTTSTDFYWSTYATTFTQFLWKSEKRFYLASPCGEKFKIEKSKCKCHVAMEPVYKFNWVEDESGGGNFVEEPAGVMRICDEPIESNDGTSFITSNGQSGTEDVDCLVVTAVSGLEGYGKDKSYENFCYSLPENLMKFYDGGLLTASVALDIGATVLAPETGGTTLMLLGISNNVIFTIAGNQAYVSLLWPTGGGT